MSENESTATDVLEFIQAQAHGLLADKVGAMLSEIALNTTMKHDLSGGKAKGKLVLKFEVACICPIEGHIDVTHDVVQVVPTKVGEDTKRLRGRTRMYMERGGKVVETQPPENLRGQSIMQFERDEF